MKKLKDYRRDLMNFGQIFEDFKNDCNNFLNYINSIAPKKLAISCRKNDLIFSWEDKHKILNPQPTCYEIILENNKKRVVIEIRMSGYIVVKAQVIHPLIPAKFIGIEEVHKLSKKMNSYVNIFHNDETNREGIILVQEEFHGILPKVFEFLLS